MDESRIRQPELEPAHRAGARRQEDEAPGRAGAATAFGRMLGLQRLAGNQAVTAMLWPGGTSGPVVQREDPKPADPAVDKDRRALAVLAGTLPSGKVWFVDPAAVRTGAKQEESMPVKCDPIVARNKADDQRKGFDTEAAAVAFAVATVGSAAVLQHDGVFFVAPCTGTGAFNRDRVRQVDLAGASKVVGADGFVYAPATYHDVLQGSVGPEKGRAEAPSSAELAKIAGVPRPGDPASTGSEQVRIPDAQVEAFLRQYLVSRGLELLNANRSYALEQQKVFAGTDKGSESRKPGGLTPAAKAQVDASREIAKKFNKIVESEISLENLERKVSRNHKVASPEEIIELDDKKLKYSTWNERIAASRQLITQGKGVILAHNPLLAQLVEQRTPIEDGFVSQAKDLVSKTPGGALTIAVWNRVMGQDNPTGRSELSSEPGKDSDEKVRTQYVERLDNVLLAIDKVKGEVLLGDIRYLMGLPGLSHRVRGELKSISGPNAVLSVKLERKVEELGMSAGEIAAKTTQVAGVVLQLAGFFFPPLEFIGAVMSFAGSAAGLSKSLDQWTASQAAVTPDTALVDPVKAQSQLIDDTLSLAMDALNLGLSVESGFKLLEESSAKSFGTPAKEKGPTDPAAPPSTGGSGLPQARIAEPVGTMPGMAFTATGLADVGAMAKYRTAMKAVEADWATLSEGDRVTRIAKSVNEQLVGHSIPSVHFVPKKLGPGGAGQFDFKTWTVVINEDAIKAAKTGEDIARITDTAYHEARHAEQWYLMARYRASLGEDAATIMAKMQTTDRFAIDMAIADSRLVAGTPEYNSAVRFWDSVYNPLTKGHRDAVLADLTTKTTAYNQTYSTHMAAWSNTSVPYATRMANYNAAVAAEGQWAGAYRQYRLLPEEIDAHGLGHAAEFGFSPVGPSAANLIPPPVP